jgi:hypothetical protein
MIDSGIFQEWISEEERILLANMESEAQGNTLTFEDWTAIVSHFYQKRGWADARYEVRDLEDGCGLHFFRPFLIAQHELDFLTERRRKALIRLKARRTRERNRGNK